MHEQILLYGGPDSGKTRALLTVAAWHQKRKSDATFYVLSSDKGYEPHLAHGEFGGLENVVVEKVVAMRDYIETADRFIEKMGENDWLVVDILNAAWEAAQDEYSHNKWGTDLADQWMTKGINEDGSPIDGWEWGKPNARYRSFANNRFQRCPGHIMCMSAETGLRTASRAGAGGETAKVKEMFERIGYKPLGQKDDPHRFHTVLHLSQVTKTKWVMNTARDRNREKMQGVELDSFMRDYLRTYGGWSL